MRDIRDQPNREPNDEPNDMTEQNTGTALPEPPTLDRLAGLREKSGTIRDFMEWLRENGYRLGGLQYHISACRRHDHGEEQDLCTCDEVAAECFGVNPGQCPHRDSHVDWLWNTPLKDRSEPVDTLLERYLDINPDDVDRERQALLAFARDQQGPEQSLTGDGGR